jgi:hypothetical protein
MGWYRRHENNALNRLKRGFVIFGRALCVVRHTWWLGGMWCLVSGELLIGFRLAFNWVLILKPSKNPLGYFLLIFTAGVV